MPVKFGDGIYKAMGTETEPLQANPEVKKSSEDTLVTLISRLSGPIPPVYKWVMFPQSGEVLYKIQNAFSHRKSDLNVNRVPRLVHKGVFNQYKILFKEYIKV